MERSITYTYPVTNVLHCIKCNKEIKRLDFHDEDKTARPSQMWSNGIVGQLYANYGSKLDGDIYLIAVCDDCIKGQHKVGEYM